MHINLPELNLIKEEAIIRLKTSALLAVDKGLMEFKGSLTELVECYHHKEFIAELGSGKLSKGENYSGLPYRVLDFPALFDAQGIFSCRTIFLWGKYFCFTLHLEGTYLDAVRTKLSKLQAQLKHREFFFCINESPWQYYFEANNYIPIDSMNEMDWNEKIASRNFIKIAAKLHFDVLGQFESNGLNFYQKQFEWLFERI